MIVSKYCIIFDTILYDYLTPKQFTKIYISNKLLYLLYIKLNIDKIYYTPKNNAELYESVDIWKNNKLRKIKNKYHISKWNTRYITNMESLFKEYYEFNEDIGDWNLSNVYNIEYMFYNCNNFNQNISNWDISNIKKLFGVFHYAYKFDFKYTLKWFNNEEFKRLFRNKTYHIIK